MSYPKQCELCQKTIESLEDLDWHGLGNCVEITDEMWDEWEQADQESTHRQDYVTSSGVGLFEVAACSLHTSA